MGSHGAGSYKAGTKAESGVLIITTRGVNCESKEVMPHCKALG